MTAADLSTHGALLTDSVRLGPVVARNRVFFAPTSVGYADDGVLTPKAIAHYARRAAGGVGAVMTEHFAVSDEGKQHHRQPAAWPDPALRPGLERLAAQIRSTGSLAIAQVSHAGRYAGPWADWASRPRLAPSAVPFPLLGDIVAPQEMTADQIRAAVGQFRAAVRNLVDAGWQGVEIHGGSGFLVSGFLSPLMNRRSDAYGGNVRRRLRFVEEVVRACREAAGESAAVGIHLMTTDLAPGGASNDDVPEVVAALQHAGIDFFRASAGTFETIRRPENADRAARADHNRSETDAIVAAASVPVIANGGLRTRADVMSAVAGGASAVALSRPLLADPDWLPKTLSGSEDLVLRCACDPPLCLQTQLAGAICAAWPAEVKAHGHSGDIPVWNPAMTGR